MRVFKTQKGTELPISVIQGKEYLEVKWRIVWFREECPDWSIETEFTDKGADYAVAKCTIRNETGRVISTAHKHEDRKGFFDFREKAETGSVGRALAFISFGTQFASELEEGSRIVDSPVSKKTKEAQKLTHHEYKVPFGKYKGMALEDLLPEELRQYCAYLQEKANKENKEIKGVVLEFMERVEAQLQSIK